MRVKIFTDYHIDTLEEKVNYALARRDEEDIYDIQFELGEGLHHAVIIFKQQERKLV